MRWSRTLGAMTAAIGLVLTASLLTGCGAVSDDPPTTPTPPTKAVAGPTAKATSPLAPSAAPAASPRPTATANAPKPTETYEVQEGDTLGTIAKRFYGDSGKWRAIFDANKDVIGDNPDAIRIGTKLKIPL